MVEVEQRVSGKRVSVPLAGPANRQGRLAAGNALGLTVNYNGALGTSVVKVFEATAAMTGLSERTAREAGFDVRVAVIHKEDHAGYYPGGRELSLKVLFEAATGRLLGSQAFGHGGVEKRIDVIAAMLMGQLTVHDLAEVDLAYAPPYSSANDPLNLVAFIAQNDLSGFSPLITAQQLEAKLRGPGGSFGARRTHRQRVCSGPCRRRVACANRLTARLTPPDSARPCLGGALPVRLSRTPGLAHSQGPRLHRGLEPHRRLGQPRARAKRTHLRAAKTPATTRCRISNARPVMARAL